MSEPHAAQVESVRTGGPASHAAISPGDRVVRVNGRTPQDYIAYRYLAAEPYVALLVEDAAGRRRRVRIAKRIDEDLGIRFTEDVFDGIRTCRNRCPFCFVAQLPRGLRPSLYVRDDDYRLSFLHGNFITLNNLIAADSARIARLRLSPLYISVHATEPRIRAKLFGGATPDVLARMRRLAAHDVEFHTQIVLCPGINDRVHLERTIRDLAALHPGVRSIGIVPVGLTRHRRGLPRIRPVGPDVAQELVASVRKWQREFAANLGTRLVFAADELYLLLGRPLPGRAHYEEFPQLANGIGCARLFLDAVRRIRPPKLQRRTTAALVTGEMAAPLVAKLAQKLRTGRNVNAKLYIVENRLLGRSVTTAGLLAGRDVARTLAQRDVGDLVIVPGTAVRDGEGFIDGMTLHQLSDRVRAPVFAASAPAEANAVLRRFHRRRRGR